MQRMRFFDRDKDKQTSQWLSNSLNYNKDVNNTGKLFGGVSYDTLRSNMNDYTDNNQEYQNKSNNPSLSGAVGTYNTISGYMGGSGIGSGGGGTPWGAIGTATKTGYNSLLGKDDTDYSDWEESIIYPLQGAAQGSALGPWGALGGALYGLGYSFKDDLGLEDNEWYTDLLFPIGMGDEHQGLGISL